MEFYRLNVVYLEARVAGQTHEKAIEMRNTAVDQKRAVLSSDRALEIFKHYDEFDETTKTMAVFRVCLNESKPDSRLDPVIFYPHNIPVCKIYSSEKKLEEKNETSRSD